ncbi:TraI/MobA(P) family conjugative relaxase [Shewanella indica]|uniref:TraI/MobA(P) family conjugative relaxase n=1 Tax=Shewanella indica TaxID=768528 RepID=A0ABU4QGV8_9GAMM|nr:TraI/MobA(P) family conjugative relaxase [Shewanella indica]MDX6018613.1 TraI/MobA(P) family conjugative relaxase [Shewanella indica]MDX6018660.1 TraI/MobA(P) family conjugative relaxase [Shewanella indica]
MIAKHVPMRSLGKSDFAGLVEYITDAQSKTERLGLVTVTNCQAGTVQAATDEVLATQHINKRAKGDKTFHLLVSFRAGENPGADTLKEIEERICAGLGYDEHQRVSAVHHDTDNLHIHIAINKIHPTRNTMHEPFQSYRTLGELCAVTERDYGLEQDNHTPARTIAEGRAADMERHAGVDSLLGWIKRECLDEIRGAQSWVALRQVMRENGLELRQRANGFVIEAGDGTMIKASTVARDLSKPRLEERLGAFEPSPEQAERTQARREYAKQPIRSRINTVELYAKYKTEQQTLVATKKADVERLGHWKDSEIEAVKRSNRLRRSSIKVLGQNRANKKLLYAQASKSLRADIQAINREFRIKKGRLSDTHRRRTWADWLKKEALRGNAEALAALRAREAAQGLQGNAVRGEGGAKPGHSPVMDNITKKGTIIYRAGKSAVRDDGDKLQVSREATEDGLVAALRLTSERYGNRITVNGTVEFKAQIIRAAVVARLPITFADPELERRRQSLLTNEGIHDRPNQDRGRTGRGVGRAGSGAATGQHDTRRGGSVERGPGRAAASAPGEQRKPNVGRIGRIPPPQGQHRLRRLSELGVVRVASGGEVLLPRDVPSNLEQQGAKPDNQLRRPLSGARAGVTPEALAAAAKYIAEREAKRLKGFDIPKHCRYNGEVGAFSYAGSRNIEGYSLALLKRGDGDDVLVVPVDPATARRVKRVSIGESVTVNAKGSITTSKGRKGRR